MHHICSEISMVVIVENIRDWMWMSPFRHNGIIFALGPKVKLLVFCEWELMFWQQHILCFSHQEVYKNMQNDVLSLKSLISFSKCCSSMDAHHSEQHAVCQLLPTLQSNAIIQLKPTLFNEYRPSMDCWPTTANCPIHLQHAILSATLIDLIKGMGNCNVSLNCGRDRKATAALQNASACIRLCLNQISIHPTVVEQTASNEWSGRPHLKGQSNFAAAQQEDETRGNQRHAPSVVWISALFCLFQALSSNHYHVSSLMSRSTEKMSRLKNYTLCGGCLSLKGNKPNVAET